jgi:lipoprotein NlpI
MIPVKIEKKDNNKCLILYFNKPIINNKYNKTNMNKDKRIFTLDYFNDNLCNWYISNMSISLWLEKNKNIQ